MSRRPSSYISTMTRVRDDPGHEPKDARVLPQRHWLRGTRNDLSRARDPPRRGHDRARRQANRQQNNREPSHAEAERYRHAVARPTQPVNAVCLDGTTEDENWTASGGRDARSSLGKEPDC